MSTKIRAVDKEVVKQGKHFNGLCPGLLCPGWVLGPATVMNILSRGSHRRLGKFHDRSCVLQVRRGTKLLRNFGSVALET